MSTVWKAGMGRRDITPRVQPIWLSGFGGRRRPSEGVLRRIFATSLVLDDGSGELSAIVSAEILGFCREMSDTIVREITARFGLTAERVTLTATHNHSAPVNTGVLPLIYNLTAEQQQVVDDYTVEINEAIVESVGDAMADLTPVKLEFGQGLAGFAVNRRRARPGCRHLPAPVDHDVPVLAIRRLDGSLRGTVFGYACHTTALSDYRISGDYSGFAQDELETIYPGALTLFVLGCAGDINPLPRGSVEGAQTFGKILATAVRDVIEDRLETVSGPLCIRRKEAILPYASLPTECELERKLSEVATEDQWLLHQTTIVPPRLRLSPEEAGKVAKTLASNERKSIRLQLDRLRKEGVLPDHCRLPVCVWSFGETFVWIHIAGEPVVDYSLRLKAEHGWNRTWVSGYYDELVCYIPSLRVLLEGDYEGTEGMREYGHPVPFAESVEQTICDTIRSLMQPTSQIST